MADTEILEEVAPKQRDLGERDRGIRGSAPSTKPSVQRVRPLQIVFRRIEFPAVRSEQPAVEQEARLPDLIPVADKSTERDRRPCERGPVSGRVSRRRMMGLMRSRR